MRTGGVYLTVDGDARNGNRIVELREMMGTEDNVLKETSLSDVCARFGTLSLWMRDYVCSCAFADGMVRKKMLDRFHAKNHTRQVCRTKYNPSTSANSRIRNRLGVWNTVACEQTFRYFRYERAESGAHFLDVNRAGRSPPNHRHLFRASIK